MRPIDADSLKHEIDDTDEFDGIGVKYYIDNEPTLNVREYINAHWIVRYGQYSRRKYVCSHRGKGSGVAGSKQWRPFCPNCGVSMAEKVEKE